MKSNLLILIALAFLAFSCGSPSQKEAEEKTTREIQQEFLNNLASLCGKSFGGWESFIIEGRESWADKKFLMHVTLCEDDRVYIPFHLDDDHSRTWMFIMEEQGLRFRHDHRYPDGTPEDNSLYGGYADESGNAFWQHFPSDEYTHKTLADGIQREWRVSLTEDLSKLSYQLFYGEELIFGAEFDLTQPL